MYSTQDAEKDQQFSEQLKRRRASVTRWRRKTKPVMITVSNEMLEEFQKTGVIKGVW